MSMLSLEEIRPGTLQDARLGSIMIPLGDHSAHFLVAGGAQDELFGVFLSGSYRFQTVMASQDGDNWPGFLVDDVRIEVDTGSAADATHHRPPPGSVVRRPGGSFLVALAGERSMLRRQVELRLGEGVGAPGERSGVAFTRWCVVTGDRDDRCVLWTVDCADGADAGVR